MDLGRKLSSADGTPLRVDVYPLAPQTSSANEPAAPPPRGTVVIVHGYCEHRGRYRHVAEYLNRHGYHVVTGDLRGHGESVGTRGYVGRFVEYLADVQAFLDVAAEALAGAPAAPVRRAGSKAPAAQKPILLAHSMGALVALRFVLENPDALRALALSSPFLGLKIAVPAWKTAMGKVASVIAPKLGLPSGLLAVDVSHDPQVVKAYDSDPLITHAARARWFTEVVAAQADVAARIGSIRVPTLMQVAGDDRIVDAAVSQKLFDRLGAADKNLTVYPGLYHEIFNETAADRQRVLSDLSNWLVEH